MALTGIVLMGFVFVHMVGNLKMYLGAGRSSTTTARSCASSSCRSSPARSSCGCCASGSSSPSSCTSTAAYGAHADEPPGPAGEVPVAARLRRRQLRLPHDALDRRHRPPLPLFHLADLTWGFAGQPRLRARRRVPERRHSLDRWPVALHLHRRQPRPRRPPLPRRLVHLPEPRARTTPASTAAATRCAGASPTGFADHRRRHQRLVPDHWSLTGVVSAAGADGADHEHDHPRLARSRAGPSRTSGTTTSST